MLSKFKALSSNPSTAVVFFFKRLLLGLVKCRAHLLHIKHSTPHPAAPGACSKTQYSLLLSRDLPGK
jgi:hypothetical protein